LLDIRCFSSGAASAELQPIVTDFKTLTRWRTRCEASVFVNGFVNETRRNHQDWAELDATLRMADSL
jgi:hypothetical protein